MEHAFDRSLLRTYMAKSNVLALWQVSGTIVAYAALWWAYLATNQYSAWLIAPYSLLGGLLVLRVFVLMHDCGHGALFSSKAGNSIAGYLLGVIAGMPQYVWSQNHAYHHATNGDWERYRGPLSILATTEYEALNNSQKKNYWRFRHAALLLPGGFFYLVANPRFTWIAGTLGLMTRILVSLVKPAVSTRQLITECSSRYWKSPRAYLHMTLNNVLLLTLWWMMCSAFGTLTFFALYVPVMAIAGGLGILLFSVQHYFEGSYAQNTANNDAQRAALEGTSQLVLPAALNWFTADIAYHHVHHLSAAIPNYNLARCHRELAAHFNGVRRISLAELPKALNYLLWDEKRSVLVSLDEHLAHQAAAQSGAAVPPPSRRQLPA